MEKLKNFDRDHLLEMLGLEMKRSNTDYLVPALTLFGVGILVGAGVGLLFAPKPGRELREDLSHRIQNAPEAIARLPQKAADLSQRAGEAISRATEQVRDAAERVKPNSVG